MTRYEASDDAMYPGTVVLRNKLGIRNQKELDEAEAAIVLLATYELGQNPLPETDAGPDFDYLLMIHRELFRDVYEWAGQVRVIDISKGTTRFANCRQILSEGQKLTKTLAAEDWLVGLELNQFVEHMAFFMGELNVLHPFRDGNGRALREYVRYLSARAGHPLTWDGVTSQEMIDASISAYHGHAKPLADILLRQINRVS